MSVTAVCTPDEWTHRSPVPPTSPRTRGRSPNRNAVLSRIAAGDRSAVDDCLQLYGGLVWSLARRFSGSDAEDAVQEIFIDIWKSAVRFDATRASEKTFIAMIARRRLIDRTRHAKRRPELRALPEDGPDPSGDQHLEMHKGVEAALAARHLKELRPEQRKAIELSVFYGMSHREIARLTKMPVGTVKSHIWRGLALVRRTLDRAGDQRIRIPA